MKLRASRRFHYSDVYTDAEGRRIHYNDQSMFYISLDAAELARSRPSNTWVRLIPVMVVVLCFVGLWWLSSHPGDSIRPIEEKLREMNIRPAVVLVLGSKAKVVTKYGRNESVLHTEVPRKPENDTRTNHAPPEHATSPVTTKSSGFANNSEDEASTDSTWTPQNSTDSEPTATEVSPPTSNSWSFRMR